MTLHDDKRSMELVSHNIS